MNNSVEIKSMKTESSDGLDSLIGYVASVIGSLLLASNMGYGFYGFVLFFIANTAWIAYALRVKSKHMLKQNIVFMATTLFGIYQFWPF